MNTKTILTFIIAVFILLVPDLIIVSEKSIGFILLNILYKVLFLLGLGTLFLYITKSYYKSYLIVGLLYLISSLTEIITVILFKNYSNLDHIKALFFVRVNEIEYFTKSFYIYAIIPLIVVVVYLIILRKMKNFSYIKKTKIIILSAAFFISSFAISGILISQTPIIFSGKKLPKYTLKKYFVKQHPFSFYYRTYELIISRIRYNKFIKVKEAFSFDVTNNNLDSLRPDNVIFVIGERTRYSNWSINGYNRETSPSLKEVTNLISFNNNHSNGASTAGSIPFLLTQGTPDNQDLIYSQKTIVSLFKEANYKTYWIANQFIFDYIEHDNEPDVFINLFKNKKHIDLDVLPVFDSIMNIKSDKKKLIVFNLAGGHGNIPKEFQKFKPFNQSENHKISKENRNQIINGYDNMILLQDYVLGKVINTTKAQNKSSFLLYTADHGTNLFDGNNTNLFGYGSSNPTKNETNVPLFVWSSEQFIDKNKNKFNSLNNHKTFLTTNDNVFYTLADMASIKYRDYKSHLSLSDSTYIEPKERLIYVNESYIKVSRNHKY